MRSRWIGWMCVGLASLAVSPMAAAADQDAFVAQGRSFAEKNCSRCHAIGETDPSLHPQAPPFRRVVERYPSEHLAEALAEGIVSGHPDMPVFVLRPDEIEAFLACLDSLGPKAKNYRPNVQPK